MSEDLLFHQVSAPVARQLPSSASDGIESTQLKFHARVLQLFDYHAGITVKHTHSPRNNTKAKSMDYRSAVILCCNPEMPFPWLCIFDIITVSAGFVSYAVLWLFCTTLKCLLRKHRTAYVAYIASGAQ